MPATLQDPLGIEMVDDPLGIETVSPSPAFVSPQGLNVSPDPLGIETPPIPDAGQPPIGKLQSVWNSIVRGVKSAQALPDVILSAGTEGMGRPTMGQRRKAYVAAMTDPAYGLRLSGARTPEEERSIEAGRGPAMRLEMAMEPQRALQAATVGELSRQQGDIATIPQSPAQQRLAAAKDWREKWKVWLHDPVELTAGIAAESLPPSIAGALLGTVAGGPGMGTAAGVGASSGLMTFASEFLNNARTAGVDVTNPDSLAAFLNDEKQFRAAFGPALVKAGIVGGVDAATAGNAGRFIEPALKQNLKARLLATGKEVGMQAAGGAGGEAAGQLAAGQKFDPFDIAMEAVAEVAGAPAEVAGNLRGQKNQESSPPRSSVSPQPGSSSPAAAPAAAAAGVSRMPGRELAAELRAQALADLPAEEQARLRKLEPEQTKTTEAKPATVQAVENLQAAVNDLQAALTGNQIAPRPKVQQPGSGTVAAEVQAAAKEWRAAEKRYRRARRQDPPDVADASDAREEAELNFRMLAEKNNLTQDQFDRLTTYAKATDTEQMPGVGQPSPTPLTEKPSSEITGPGAAAKTSITGQNERTGSDATAATTLAAEQMPAEATARDAGTQPAPVTGTAGVSTPRPTPKPRKSRLSSLTDEDGLLYDLVGNHGKIRLFLPTPFAIANYKRLLAKQKTGVLTTAERAWLQRMAEARPENAEDDYGVDFEQARAAYNAARRAGIDVELFALRESGQGLGLDQVLDFVRERKGDDYSANDLWADIERLANAHHGRREAGSQAERFNQIVREGKRPKAQKGTFTRILAEMVKPGDTFEVQGQQFEVEWVERDEKGNPVYLQLKDGPKFGVQQVGADEWLFIDKESLELGAEHDETPADIPQAALKQPERFSLAEGDFQLNAPESVAEQRAREKAETLKAEKLKAADQMRQRAGQRLTGQDVDTTAEMFGGAEGRTTRQDKSGQGSLFSLAETPDRLAGRAEELDQIAQDLFGKPYDELTTYQKGDVEVTLEHEDARQQKENDALAYEAERQREAGQFFPRSAIGNRQSAIPSPVSAAPRTERADVRPAASAQPAAGSPARPVRPAAAPAEAGRQREQLAQPDFWERQRAGQPRPKPVRRPPLPLAAGKAQQMLSGAIIAGDDATAAWLDRAARQGLITGTPGQIADFNARLDRVMDPAATAGEWQAELRFSLAHQGETTANIPSRNNPPSTTQLRDSAGAGAQTAPDATAGFRRVETLDPRTEAARARLEAGARALARNKNVTAGPVTVLAPGPAAGRGLSASRVLAKLFGGRLVFFRIDGQISESLEGWTSPDGSLWLNVENQKRAHLAVTGHELLHRLKLEAPELYRRLLAAVRPHIADFAGFEADARRRGYTGSTPLIEEELLANLAGDSFLETEFWDALSRENPTVFRRAAAWVIQKLDNLLGMLRRQGYRSERWFSDIEAAREHLARALGEFASAERGVRSAEGRASLSPEALREKVQARSDRARTVRDRAFDELARRRQAAEKSADALRETPEEYLTEAEAPQPDARYSLDEPGRADAERYRQDFLRWRLGELPPQAWLTIGRSPEALRAAGIPDGEIYISQEVLNKKPGEHGFPVQKLTRLPEALADPILVHESWTAPDSYVALLDLQRGGQNLGAALHFRTTTRGLEVTEISSVYPRATAQIMEAIRRTGGRGGVTYYHKEKVRQWLARQSGFTSPHGLAPLFGQPDIPTNHDLGQGRFSLADDYLGTPEERGYGKKSESGKAETLKPSAEKSAATENQSANQDLLDQVSQAEADLKAAISQHMTPPEGMTKAAALRAKEAAGSKLRRLQFQLLQRLTGPNNADAARSPEQTAELISQTADLFNSVQEEIARMKAAGEGVPSDLNKMRKDLQVRLMTLKGWADDQAEAAAAGQRAARPPQPGSGLRQREREFEGATNSEHKTFGEFVSAVITGLKNVVSPLPELPIGGEAGRQSAVFRRGYRLFAAESNRVKREAAEKIAKVLQPLQALRTREMNAVWKQYTALARKLTNFRAAGEDAKAAEVDARMDALEQQLYKDPFQLFRLAVLYRDLWWRGTYLKNEQGKPITLPQGFEPETIARRLSELEAQIKASPHQAAIRQTLKNHYALTDELQKSILAHGEIIPEALRNPLYFPHHILDYWRGAVDRVRPSTEEDFRRYLIAPVGSGKLIQADYLKAMYVHTADVLAHNARVGLVHKYWQGYDISERLKAEHGENWDKPWNLPAGYKLFAPFKKLPLRMDYILSREVLADKLGVLFNDGDLRARMGEAGAVLKVSPEDLHAALVAGEKIKWALPVEIADALEGISRREAARSNPGLGHALGLPARKTINFWKKTKLFAWWNWPRYEYGNTMTDLVDKWWVADPGMGRFIPQAARELWAAGKPGATFSKDFKAAAREGVFETITESEIQNLDKIPEFKGFLTQREASRAAARQFAGWTVRASRFREATFRYAKFLADVQRMRAGKDPVYGGAYHGDIEALGETVQGQRQMLQGDDLLYARAAEISLKHFGDYNSLSVFSQWLRQYLIPFVSWQDVNFRYHANLIRNMADGAVDVRLVLKYGTARSLRLAVSGAKITGMLFAVAVARELWNQFGPKAGADDDDLESKLSEADRRRAHILLGQDAEGRAMVVYTPGALADVAEWVGGQNGKRLFMEWVRGQITFDQMVSDYAKQLPKDVVNKLASSIGPAGKPIEAVTGKALFPDVFDQRSIPDSERWWRLVGGMTDDRAVGWLRNVFDQDYYSPRASDQLQQMILQIRRRDPEQWAYYEAREAAADWKEKKTGKRFEHGSYNAPEAQALRNFRSAIYRGDVAEADRFYRRLREFGYTEERFKASLRAQHPLADLNEDQRREYTRQLDARARRELELAQKYYQRLTSAKGHYAFPRK